MTVNYVECDRQGGIVTEHCKFYPLLSNVRFPNWLRFSSMTQSCMQLIHSLDLEAKHNLVPLRVLKTGKRNASTRNTSYLYG